MVPKKEILDSTPELPFDSANNVDGKQVVTHDEFLDLKIDEAVKARMSAMTMNSLSIGCSITDKKIIPGKEKLDKDKNPTGQYWDDSYSVELSFEGGKFGVRVDAPTFQLLEVGSARYLAKGTIETKVNEFGFSMPNVKITSFDRLF